MEIISGDDIEQGFERFPAAMIKNGF